ncbi:MAG TPA: EAL domain-containing protein [Solirubrobacteraceae bacterium]|nr:EAL domain-containing protein [Solirubrobacteraceae bacterium]
MDSELIVIAEGRPKAEPVSVLRRLLPVTENLGRVQRRLVVAGFVLLAAAILVDGAHVVLGLGGATWESVLRGPVIGAANGIAAALVVMRAAIERRHRLLWALTALAVCSYAIGFMLWGFWLVHLRHPPNPSIAVYFFRAFYPLIWCVVIAAGGRRSQNHASLEIWLDGLIAATATAAAGTAFVLPVMLRDAHSAHGAVVNVFQWPILDLVLWALLIAVIGLRGWRLELKWTLFLAAATLLLTADISWAAQITHGASTGNSTDALGYLSAFLCLAAACWQPDHPQPHEHSRPWSTLILPTIFTLAAPTILVYDHFSRVHLDVFVLTMIAMAAAMLRLALALRDMLTLNEMRRAAHTDELTCLPNRRMFLTSLTAAIARAEQQGVALTAMLLDLDNFKQINDTLGHSAGDQLLRMIGPRLARAVRDGDLVARLGGDEFAILLERDSEADAARAVAEAVGAAVRRPFQVQDVTLRLSGSIGIARYPDDAESAEGLIQCIDVAMYEAKAAGRDWERYSSERNTYTRQRLELGDALAGALESGAIEAHFQPVVEASTRRIVAAEALVRWRLPDGSLRPPAEFLHTAEVTGLSRQLTRRMLTLALGQIQAWRLIAPRLFVAVNATVADLLDESFPDEVAAALDAHGLSPDALAVEVTEGEIVADPGRAGAVLERLHRLGVRIALDDFGTGYSSLTHLRELPVDAVKIDRSFVSRMLEQEADAVIVETIIELAHRLKLTVVAEGVEDEETWQAVRRLGSDRIQGYAAGRPLSSEAFRALLEGSSSNGGRLGTLQRAQAHTASSGRIG